MPLPLALAVHTQRLVLRPVIEGDLPELLQINGDDAVTKFLPYASWSTPEDGQAWLARMHNLQATGTAQQLVMQRLADGRVIGTALVFKYDEGSARAEIGYVVGRAHWREGYAREALRGLCTHAFNTLGLRRLEAEVNPANQASHQLLRQLGFTEEGRLRQRWVAKGQAYDTLVFGCLATEWQHEKAPHA
jgi:[ribosomal protein S5]-alanine N-acetyltransferase